MLRCSFCHKSQDAVAKLANERPQVAEAAD